MLISWRRDVAANVYLLVFTVKTSPSSRVLTDGAVMLLWCDEDDPGPPTITWRLLSLHFYLLVALQSFVSETRRCTQMVSCGWSKRSVFQRPPSRDAGLSERPSLAPADDFFCFCFDFLNIRTCGHTRSG